MLYNVFFFLKITYFRYRKNCCTETEYDNFDPRHCVFLQINFFFRIPGLKIFKGGCLSKLHLIKNISYNLRKTSRNPKHIIKLGGNYFAISKDIFF